MTSDGYYSAAGRPRTAPGRPNEHPENVTWSPHKADYPTIAPQISTADINGGTSSEPIVHDARQVEHGSGLVHHRMLEESATQHPSSQSGPSQPTRVDFLARHAANQASPENLRASVRHQGQTGYRSLGYHPHSQRADYLAPYVLPAQHMAVVNPTSLPYTYHGYHHPQGPSPSNSPYPITPVYQAAHTSTQTSQSGPHPPLVASSYPALQYAPPPEYSYHHSSYSSNSPPSYPQYGPGSYPQHFGPSSYSGRHGTWWYMPTGHPLSQRHQFEGNRSHHPGFQQHYSYPFIPLGSQSMESTHSLTSVTSPAPQSSPRASASLRQGQTITSHSTQPQVEPISEAAQEGPLVRKSYHPKPPIHRSEWTMWAGNVPSDARQDEVWSFFSRLPSLSQSEINDVDPVVSVFLINRSSCAFINYDTEPHLNEAIENFNGRPLRLNDARCPKLVCRVRKKDEDLRAGVGGQRGMGMHTKWVKEQIAKGSLSPSPGLEEDSTFSPVRVRVVQSLSVSSSDEERRRQTQPKQSSSSGLHASTTSSFLSHYFPKRFFILKSLSEHDLDLSVEKGLWATQKHNEGVLDQAFRTSREVFLIFGVNKSGEFYGYARMAGPIQSGEQEVAWETSKAETPSRTPPFLSLGDRRLASHDPFVTDAAHNQTAPAEVGTRQRLSVMVPQHHHTLGAPLRRPETSMSKTIRLDLEAPKQAMRQRTEENAEELDLEEVKGDEGSELEHTWGESFRVEWICLERMPFHRIKHLRNPWNHDREVKVSRDGTELEPIVGRKLIEEWRMLAAGGDPPLPAGSGSKARRAVSRRNKPAT